MSIILLAAHQRPTALQRVEIPAASRLGVLRSGMAADAISESRAARDAAFRLACVCILSQTDPTGFYKAMAASIARELLSALVPDED